MESFRRIRYLEIFWTQLRNNLIREAVYRANLVTMVLVDLIWIGVEFALFAVIYANVPTLAGWTQPQVYFFLGVFFATEAVFATFFQRNFWEFSGLVNKGELDILLTKPAHPLFLALTRYMSVTGWLNVVFGLAIMIRYAQPAGFEGGVLWLMVPVWMLVGVLIALLVRFLFSVWIFWTERSWAISRLYYQFFALATKPDTIYPSMVRYVILTILPFAFIGSVPARALLHGLDPREYLVLVLVVISFTTVNALLWRAGLRRYQSASS